MGPRLARSETRDLARAVGTHADVAPLVAPRHLPPRAGRSAPLWWLGPRETVEDE